MLKCLILIYFKVTTEDIEISSEKRHLAAWRNQLQSEPKKTPLDVQITNNKEKVKHIVDMN